MLKIAQKCCVTLRVFAFFGGEAKKIFPKLLFLCADNFIKVLERR